VVTQNKVTETNAEPFSGGVVLQATKADSTRALFTLFDNLDSNLLGKLLSVLACILLATYFITSADSGTLILCILDAA
ncbi:BCCT family transporter, partial [Bacillus sp. SIMBA_031]